MEKRETKKHIRPLIVFSLFAALILMLPAQKIKAEAETGLLAADWLDWEEDVPKANPEAEYRKELGTSLLGTSLSLKYKENASENGNAILSNQISIKSQGEDGVFREDPTATVAGNEKNKEITELLFSHCGEYRICYKPDNGEESYVTLYVELPQIGFYKNSTASDSTILHNLQITENSNEFYMILTSNGSQSIDFQSFRVNWNEETNVEDYLKYEAVDDKTYKITANPHLIASEPDGIELSARGNITESDGNKWDFECTVYIGYDSEKTLWYTDQFSDNWHENGPEDISDDAEYRKEDIWVSLPYDNWLSLKYGTDMVNAEQLSITDIWGNPVENATIWNGSREGIIGMHVQKTGTYIIACQKDGKLAGARKIIADYPSIGFYHGKTLSDEGLLTNKAGNDYEFSYEKLSNRTFYLLYNDDKEMSISDLNTTTYFRNNDGIWEERPSDILSKKPLPDNRGYEFTIKEFTEEEFFLKVTCKKTYHHEDGSIEEYDDEATIQLIPSNAPIETGEKFTVKDVTYQITSIKEGQCEVSCVSISKKTVKTTIPSTVTIGKITYKVTTIADKAFTSCTKLTKITLPNSITKIGSRAFAKCTSLKSITIPKNVTDIGKEAFKDCKNLNKVTIKGTKIKKIGINAFKNVSKKITIKVPKSKKSAYKKLLKNSGYKQSIK